MGFRYFIRINGISGDSTTQGFEGWFNLLDFSFGASNSGGLVFSDLVAGKTNLQDLSVAIDNSTSLTALLAALSSGADLGSVEVRAINDDGQVIYDLTLNDVRLSSITEGESEGGNAAPIASFNFGTFGLVTHEQNPDGTLAPPESVGWSVLTNTPVDPASLDHPTSTSTAPSAEPVAYFLRIDGIDGNSTSKGHEGWFELPSFSFGGFNAVSASAGGGGGDVSKTVFSDLSLLLSDNLALSALFTQSVSGASIAALEIEGVSALGHTVYDLTLNDVLVTSVQQGDTRGGISETSATFSYGQIGLVTNAELPSGALGPDRAFGWDLTTSKAIAPADLIEPSAGSADPVLDPVSYFLRIDGIDGDSSAKGFSEWIELESFSFGESISGAISGGSGLPSFSDIALVLRGSTALTALMSASATGVHILSAEIRGVAGTGISGTSVVYDLTLNHVLVSSVQQSDASDGDSVDYSFINLNYGQIGLVTTSLNPDGSAGTQHSFGWDLTTSKAIEPADLLTPDSGHVDPAGSAVTYFLKIDGVAGDSLDTNHKGWFEISSFSLGESNSGSAALGGGAGAGIVNFGDLNVNLQNNGLLAALLLDSAAGKYLPAIEIEGVTSSASGQQRTVYDLTLNEVQVSSISHSAFGGEQPSTALSFHYGEISVVTNSLNSDGTLGPSQSFAWDVADNKAITPADVAAPVASGAPSSPAPTTYFLRISGIDGDATSKGHEGWFELPAFSFNLTNVPTSATGSGAGAGIASFSDLNVLLTDNTALAALLFESASGKFLTALEIEGVNAANQVIYDLTLNGVHVSSAQSNASEGADGMATAYSFGYQQISLVTNSVLSNGTLGPAQTFGWDLANNRQLTTALTTPIAGNNDGAGDPVAYFIKIDGISGDSTSKGHEGWLDLSSFSLAAFNPVSLTAGSGASAGRISFSDLSMILSGSTALAELLALNVAGSEIRGIEIEGVAAGGQVVYDLTLNHVLVTSVAMNGSEGADPVTGSVAFTFAQIGLVTTELHPNGSLGDDFSFGWDGAENRPIDPATLYTPADSPPSVTISAQVLDHDTGASGSDLVTSDGHVTLTGTASDNGSIVSVHVFDGLTDLGQASLNGTDWTFSADLAPGIHNLYAVATDNSGSTAETAVQPSITVDGTGPLVSVTSQVLTVDSGASGADLVTNDGRVTLTGTASDANGVTGVHIFDGATDLGAATLNAGSWSFATTLAAGAHTLRAVATDTAGNTTSSAVQPSITVDGTGPLVSVTSQVLTVDSGASGADLVTNDGRVTLTGTASDANGVTGVHVFDGATDLGAATLNAGSWSFATTLAAGAHTLRAVATDTAGNTASSALQSQIVVDTTLPTVAVTSQLLTNDTGLSASDLVTSDGRVTLTGTVGDNTAVASVRVFDGATDLGAATLVGSTWTFATTLAVGTHSLRAVASDSAGNTVQTATQPQISVVAYDPIVGQTGQTVVGGTSHEDTIVFAGSNTVITAGGGDDLIAIRAGATAGLHYIDGGTGIDTLDLSALTTANTVNLASMIATGPQLGVTALSSIENVIGGSAVDTITASAARNVFTGGGGADRFVFATLNAAANGATFVPGTGDIIKDFRSTLDGAGALHDIIDLRGIDAIQGGRDDAFVFNATPWDGTGNQFTGAGQLRYQYVFDGQGQEHTIIAGNVNSSGQGNGLLADFQIDLLGHHLLGANDFIA
ncbi:type VI secretion system tube protein Hcp [Novosphingobium aquiterrae]|uniref:Type VI secretion system tube protein Hcp n=1 Tax=Novosphingobium aquiterrae TaxID=624388 RepID=A0ABV6PEG7_9SPHN